MPLSGLRCLLLLAAAHQLPHQPVVFLPPPPFPLLPLRRNMKAFITTRLIDHYEMLIWAQGKWG